MWWDDWSIFRRGGRHQVEETTASSVPEIDASSGALRWLWLPQRCCWLGKYAAARARNPFPKAERHPTVTSDVFLFGLLHMSCP